MQSLSKRNRNAYAKYQTVQEYEFVMLTYLPFNEMMDFYHHYHIANYPQITMARDTKFYFPIYFRVRNLPSIFIYDKTGHLKKSFEGDVKPETLLAEL